MVRVVIDRRLAEGTVDQLQQTMRELRGTAIHRPGYLSGETLRDAADPNHYVILSTWRSREEWETWHASEDRRRMEERILPLLAEPESITVLEPV